MFDTRILPNPYWEKDLRPLTGRDAAVQQWLESKPAVIRMRQDIQAFMHSWLPEFQDAQRSYVTIGIGCTGGDTGLSTWQKNWQHPSLMSMKTYWFIIVKHLPGTIPDQSGGGILSRLFIIACRFIIEHRDLFEGRPQIP